MFLKNMIRKDEIKIAAVFLAVFVISFAVLYFLNYVPSELKEQNISTTTPPAMSSTEVGNKIYEYPIRIAIEKIGVNSIVQNPTTTNVYALDELLLNGVVRYPGSGLSGEGNMFLFGHSTGLKVVNNQAFKAFNNLKDLLPGDTILVYGEKNIYTYRVNNVRLANSSDVLVDFSVKKTMLTLSTCNTFGQKQERYVIEADFVGSNKL